MFKREVCQCFFYKTTIFPNKKVFYGMETYEKNIPDEIIAQICVIQKDILQEKTDENQIKSLSENGVLFFIELDENQKILSFCSVKPSEFDWEIYDVATIPVARNRGLAKKIISEVLDFAQKENAEKIFLEVRENNKAAINLYEKLGFEKYLIRKNYYADNSENAVCMMKKLTRHSR
jgi:ribosomal-protein-alanine N-acetyltransferase